MKFKEKHGQRTSCSRKADSHKFNLTLLKSMILVFESQKHTQEKKFLLIQYVNPMFCCSYV